MKIVEIDRGSDSIIATVGVMNIPPVQKKAYLAGIGRKVRKATGLNNVVIVPLEDLSAFNMTLIKPELAKKV